MRIMYSLIILVMLILVGLVMNVAGVGQYALSEMKYEMVFDWIVVLFMIEYFMRAK